MKTGSDYLIDNNIETIDFLKIDVEGHDLNVLEGFDQYLKNVRIIQFEYGVFNVDSKGLLVDFYYLLSGFGFILGRLYPNKVLFSEYNHSP